MAAFERVVRITIIVKMRRGRLIGQKARGVGIKGRGIVPSCVWPSNKVGEADSQCPVASLGLSRRHGKVPEGTPYFLDVCNPYSKYVPFVYTVGGLPLQRRPAIHASHRNRTEVNACYQGEDGGRV